MGDALPLEVLGLLIQCVHTFGLSMSFPRCEVGAFPAATHPRWPRLPHHQMVLRLPVALFVRERREVEVEEVAEGFAVMF